MSHPVSTITTFSASGFGQIEFESWKLSESRKSVFVPFVLDPEDIEDVERIRTTVNRLTRVHQVRCHLVDDRNTRMTLVVSIIGIDMTIDAFVAKFTADMVEVFRKYGTQKKSVTRTHAAAQTSTTHESSSAAPESTTRTRRRPGRRSPRNKGNMKRPT